MTCVNNPGDPGFNFLLLPPRRFPVCCPVTYQCGDFEGHGTVWNLSLTGWRISGNLPLLIENVCSVTMTMPNEKMRYALDAAVHWVQRGEEYVV